MLLVHLRIIRMALRANLRSEMLSVVKLSKIIRVAFKATLRSEMLSVVKHSTTGMSVVYIECEMTVHPVFRKL